MIWSIQGPVQATGLDWVVIVTGGVGLRAMVPPDTVSRIISGDSSEVALFTEMVVREDSMTLYGFLDSDSRDTFKVLMGVSGIGPRTALAAMSVFTPEKLRDAVNGSDEAALTKIPGVGKKSAQRMLLELGGKLPKPGSHGGESSGRSMRVDVEEALSQLGWTKAQVGKILDELGDEYEDAGSMIRAALQALAGRNG